MSAERSRLPKWAQRELEVLEANVAYWKGKATVGPENSDTFLHYFPDDRPLGEGVLVRFVIEPPSKGNCIGRYIDAKLHRGRLTVRASDGLSVLPRAANSIEVECVRPS